MRTPAMLRWAAALAVLLAVAAPAAGFYLPGVAPSDFAKVCSFHAVSLPPWCPLEWLCNCVRVRSWI
jgi:hypothetical protein